jgi:hypothetical protein
MMPWAGHGGRSLPLRNESVAREVVPEDCMGSGTHKIPVNRSALTKFWLPQSREIIIFLR